MLKPHPFWQTKSLFLGLAILLTILLWMTGITVFFLAVDEAPYSLTLGERALVCFWPATAGTVLTLITSRIERRWKADKKYNAND